MTTKPTLFLCSCDNSQKIDAKGIAKALELDSPPKIYEQLCRSQIEALNSASAAGSQATICCTQEAPVLMEAWTECNEDSPVPTFVNIRENAGWSDEGPKAASKMAALIAEAQIDIAGATIVSMASDGRTIILGQDDAALEAAKRLAQHLDVTVLLTKTDNILPPTLGEVPVYAGSVAQASGHLGNFSVTIKGLSTLDPSSRGKVRFSTLGSDADNLDADILIDMRSAPALFPVPEKRDGYLRADPANPAAVERALSEALNLVGEFEKPRYVKHAASTCAHARNGIVACTRCIDVCPTSAIQPDGEHVAIDPYICAGCGECSAVCPTGANSYQHPTVPGIMARAQSLICTFNKASGTAPALLLSDASYGADAVSMMARYGRGLPARVLPFTVNTITSVGLDTLLGLVAYGASRVLLLANPTQTEELPALKEQVEYANIILEGLGYGAGYIAVIEEADPMTVEDMLWSLPKDAAVPANNFTVAGEKRETLSLALGHLHAKAPTPQDRIALPMGAPFGAVTIDNDACTLCLACTSACPAAALKDNPDQPELRFRESACVQCGLCQKTCPEKAITLSPGIDFTGAARNFTVLKSEEPFECIRCSKPFGTKASIERMAEKLKDHAMFSGPGGLDKLKMCENCRVEAMTEQKDDPFVSEGKRPITRTTEDYLREREREAAKLRDDEKKPN